MDRDGQHVVTLPEDALGAVAVVAVDVERGDALRPGGPQRLHRQGGIVDVAMAAGAGGIGVVAGRAAERIGGAARRGLGRGGERHAGGGEARLPGAGADRAGGVGAVPAGLADDVVAGPGAIGQHLGRGMDIRHHFRPGIRQRRPGRGGGRQEIDVVGRVHARQRGAVGRCRDLRRDVQRRAVPPAARRRVPAPRNSGGPRRGSGRSAACAGPGRGDGRRAWQGG